jgi:hypothetical protein
MDDEVGGEVRGEATKPRWGVWGRKEKQQAAFLFPSPLFCPIIVPVPFSALVFCARGNETADERRWEKMRNGQEW